MNIILASKSPRRREILKRLVDDFEIIESNFDETSIIFNGSPEEYVKELSINKAKAVAKVTEKDSIIIAADTVVVFDNKILEKPKDKEEAFCMLSMLSGNTHNVYSGVSILNTEGKILESESVSTEVTFSKLNVEQINKYIDSGEPFDKAGAYGIQGLGGVFVEEIRGCYYNVVGLPMNKLYKMLQKCDL